MIARSQHPTNATTAPTRLGRVIPFSYRGVYEDDDEERDEEIGRLLSQYGGRTIWLLDIRLDPAADKRWSQYRGEILKEYWPKQYRHAKGLGRRLEDGQLLKPEPAIKLMLQMMQQGESFLLWSDQLAHAQEVERFVHRTARAQRIPIEDPYRVKPGDLCRHTDPETGEVGDRIVCFRRPNVYQFCVHELVDTLSDDVDVAHLKVVEPGAYLCQRCGHGERTVKVRPNFGQKLCKHCNWLRELDPEDNEGGTPRG